MIAFSRKLLLYFVLCVLGTCLSLAQSSHVSRAQTGFSVIAAYPAPNSLLVQTNAGVGATFSSVINPATFTDTTMFVVGSVTGRHTFFSTWDPGGTNISIVPAQNFVYGENVRVTFTSGLSSAANAPLTGGYSWTFSVKTAYGSGRFGLAASPQITIGVSSGIATGDFNKDGFADVAVMDSAQGKVNVLLNSRHGGFLPATSYQVGTAPDAILSADVDGDGNLDLVVANWGTGDISILKNDGTGAFGAAVPYIVGTNPSALAAADIDNDGDVDLVVTNSGSNSISVLINNGSGTFAVQPPITVGTAPTGVAVADFNGDGLVDAAVTNKTSGSVSILKNISGSLSVDTTYLISGASSPNGLSAFDFDKNGTADLAIAYGGSGNIAILLNGYNGLPVGRFNTGFPLISVGATPYGLYGNDFDADGDIDLAVANSATNVTVFLNNGIGAPTPEDIPALKTSRAIAGVDFSGQGVMDLVVCSADGKLRILRDSVKTGLTPVVSTSASSIGFGTTADSASSNVVLYSSLLATRIDSIRSDAPFVFSSAALPKNLNPYDSLAVHIVFKPTAGIPYSGSLRIYSTTSAPSLVTIPLAGTGDPSLAVEEPTGKVPQSFALEQNYPNPFNPVTSIGFQLSAVSDISLKIYDLNGREVATLAKGRQSPGTYTVHWDATRCASGIYLCKLSAISTGGRTLFISTMKMILLK